MTTQVCSACKCELPLESFSPSRRGKAGHRCKPCFASRQRERYKNDPEFRAKNNARLKTWKKQNKERWDAANRAHYERNKAVMDARSLAWIAANLDKHKQAVARWIRENRAHVNELTMRRHARKMNQTPADADFEAIRVFYEEARRRTVETGIKHEVDHKMPLARGGLHHQSNLQILTKSENARKRDRL